jgi:DNA polymerase-3 subunit beta
MKFIVSSSALLKNIQKINGVLNSSNTLPILDNFLFQVNNDTLKISASDLETIITTKLSIQSNDEGAICIPARLLTDTLKNFPDQPLIFNCSLQDFSIEISSDYGKYKLSGYAEEGFPELPIIENSTLLSLPSKSFHKGITTTSFATGNDELRPVMSGVFLELNTQDITFVATDAHKLVRYKRKDVGSEVGTSFIIPNKPLNLLKNLCSSFDSDITIEYNQNNALFVIGDVKMVCRFVEGKYPNYNAVIPVETPNVLTIDRNLLLGSLKRVFNFANKTTYSVKLNLVGSSLEISTEDLDFSNKANENLTCNYVGEDLTIGFNAKFFIELLNNLNSAEIQLKLHSQNKPGLVIPVLENENEEDILMLIMPVMV